MILTGSGEKNRGFMEMVIEPQPKKAQNGGVWLEYVHYKSYYENILNMSFEKDNREYLKK
jgi:hypothetical protein